MRGLAGRILKELRGPSSLAGAALPGEFVLPSYGGFGLANVPATVLDHFGVPSGPGAPLDAEVVGEHLKGARKLVVLLVDALGYLALAELMAAERSLGLNRLARRGRLVPLTSVFPSTTAVALSTLHTALPPSGHGVTGYRMLLPDRGVLANMIRLSPDSDERPNGLFRTDADARALLGVPTVHRRLTGAGVRSYCLIQEPIFGSGLSKMLYAGATAVIPFVSAADLFVQVRRLVEADREAPACIWAYWGALDTIQHRYGTPGAELRAELRSLDFSLCRELMDPLAGARGVRASLMLLADHGQVQVGAEAVVPFSRLRRLRRVLAFPPAGTGRSSYLYLRERGEEPAVRKALEGRAVVVEAREALAAGLWGAGRVRADVPGRVGDLVALMEDSYTLFYPYRKGTRPSDLAGGRHGGLHEREMLVPFLCARL